ncbi:MAG: hypothetical protein OHK0045_01720 [Raineya sp.]
MRFIFLTIIAFSFLLPSCKNKEKQEFTAKQAKVVENIDDTEEIDYGFLEKYSSTPQTAIIDSMAVAFLKQWDLQGMSIAITKNEELVYAKGFGFADKERNVVAKPHHLFRIASASKLLTAVAIMKLVEEEKFSLESKVFGADGLLKRYNHWIKDTTMYQITIRHLLTHTAGWRNQLRTDPMFVPVLVAQILNRPSPISFEDTMEFMLSQRGVFKPGSFYDYSNFGYCLLGKVIEEVTGKHYEKYVQEQILAPIGITRMRIGKNRYSERFAHEVKYYTAPHTPQNLSIYNPKDSASRAYEGNNIEVLGAAGGWIASSVDMLKLLTAIDGWDRKKDLLKKKSIEEMTLHQPDSLAISRALGWKQITPEKWWRTGNLASTNISLTRRNDGYAWVAITNTGSWRASFFPYEIEAMMQRAIQKAQFPQQDLFSLIK